jgi:hypothetical protein
LPLLNLSPPIKVLRNLNGLDATDAEELAAVDLDCFFRHGMLCDEVTTSCLAYSLSLSSVSGLLQPQLGTSPAFDLTASDAWIG